MTDPMTPVRALIEAAGKATPGDWIVSREEAEIDPPHPDWFLQACCGDNWDNIANFGSSAWEDGWVYTEDQKHANALFVASARAATASISQLLAEHDKVVALIAEIYDFKFQGGSGNCHDVADRLREIQEGK